MVETNNANNQLVNADLILENDNTENLETMAISNTEELSQTQTIIEEQAKEIKQLKKEIEELKQSK